MGRYKKRTSRQGQFGKYQRVCRRMRRRKKTELHDSLVGQHSLLGCVYDGADSPEAGSESSSHVWDTHVITESLAPSWHGVR
jgi:hypothetical protein